MRTPLSIETVLVDRYSILKVLYQGAAGWVYLAMDLLTNKVHVLEEAVDDLQGLLTEFKLRNVAQYSDVLTDQDQLYLVRNYIEGHSYRELLEQQRTFSEAEVMRFLKQMLVILRSLHRLEIAHQNLSLNSIIQRSDCSLVLTEFTKANFSDHYDSDLYNLAVIAIVLLTGCDPKSLYNETSEQWEWHDWEPVNPKLAKVLDRMLSTDQRYPTATKVLQALSTPDQKEIASLVFTFVLIGLAAISAYRLINHLSTVQPELVTPSIAVDAASTPPETIAQKTKRLKVQPALLSQLSAETTQSPETILKRLELLSQEARSGMGTYKRSNYENWQAKRSSNMSDRAIETLSDAQFVAWFPDQKSKLLNPRTFGQVWYAIAFDRTKTKFDSQTSGTLKNGVGKVYRSQFKQGQTVKLTTSSDQLMIWMFLDETTVLKNYRQSNWSGKIQRSGNYEIVIAPVSTTPVQYDLKIEAN